MHITVSDIEGGIAAVVLLGTAALTAYQQLALTFLKTQAAIHKAQIEDLQSVKANVVSSAPTPVTINMPPQNGST